MSGEQDRGLPQARLGLLKVHSRDAYVRWDTERSRSDRLQAMLLESCLGFRKAAGRSGQTPMALTRRQVIRSKGKRIISHSSSKLPSRKRKKQKSSAHHPRGWETQAALTFPLRGGSRMAALTTPKDARRRTALTNPNEGSDRNANRSRSGNVTENQISCQPTGPRLNSRRSVRRRSRPGMEGLGVTGLEAQRPVLEEAGKIPPAAGACGGKSRTGSPSSLTAPRSMVGECEQVPGGGRWESEERRG